MQNKFTGNKEIKKWPAENNNKYSDTQSPPNCYFFQVVRNVSINNYE